MNLKVPKVAMTLMLICLVIINIVVIGVIDSSGSADTKTDAETQNSGFATLPSMTTTEPSATEPTTTTTTTEFREKVVLEYPYYVEVDKKAQVITVFTTNEEGKYEKLVRQMICSTGENRKKFPDGLYKLKDRKFEWRNMLSHGEPMWAQYACTITGDFMFHSVPYKRNGDNSSLDEWRYKELGTECTGGCIRLTVEGAKWIYDNCPPGTPVRILTGDTYDKELVESLRPPAPKNGWDPTDPDPKNPNYQPLITTPDPQPDPYAPLYDYDWEWAPEVPKVQWTKAPTETTTTAPAETTAAPAETTTAPAETTAAPTEAPTASPTAAPTEPSAEG